MTSRRSSRPDAALVLVALLLASCATYEAVTAAPPEFWMTVENIVLAVIHDVQSLLALFF